MRRAVEGQGGVLLCGVCVFRDAAVAEDESGADEDKGVDEGVDEEIRTAVGVEGDGGGVVGDVVTPPRREDASGRNMRARVFRWEALVVVDGGRMSVTGVGWVGEMMAVWAGECGSAGGVVFRGSSCVVGVMLGGEGCECEVVHGVVGCAAGVMLQGGGCAGRLPVSEDRAET